MDKTETLFLAAVIVILLAILFVMPEFRWLIGILLVLAVVILLLTALGKYRGKYENPKISNIFCIIAVILFIILFAGSIYSDFTNNKPVIDGLILVILFVISMSIGWFFDEK